MSENVKTTMNLNLDIRERPDKLFKWVGLSFQHVLAMFGATVLVPILTGLDVGVALFASGMGTLIYILCTGARVPVYLGSSFAYIAAIQIATANSGIESAFVGLFVVGIIYAIVSIIVTYAGVGWLKKLLPPVVMGPMIIIIGLSLASVAINQIGAGSSDVAVSLSDNWKGILIAFVTIMFTIITATKAEGFWKVIPFLVGIAAGYAFAALIGEVNFDSFKNVDFIKAPDFKMIGSYDLDFSAVLTFAPLAFVTIAEHIGDHKVLGEVTGKDFLEEPGLNRTLLGDGLATAASAMLGGPANTTYGENTGVVAMTKVASVYVTGLAAVFAIIMSFIGFVPAAINSIPLSVMGGISVILFGLIASNGIKILQKVDLKNMNNILVISVMLIFGIGQANIKINDATSLSGMSIAVLVGVLVHQILKGLDIVLGVDSEEVANYFDEEKKLSKLYMKKKPKAVKKAEKSLSQEEQSERLQKKGVLKIVEPSWVNKKTFKRRVKKPKKDNRHRPKRSKGNTHKL